MNSWSAGQYLQFEAERNRPIHDLIAQIPLKAPASAVDLGCGPGNSTQILAERYPQAQVSGLDSAPDMIRAARERLPGVDFTLDDISGWSERSGRHDLLLSNAALQWVGNHAQMFPALIHRLTPGGVLAVQMPDNLDEPIHQLMRQVAQEGPWADRLTDAATARHPRFSAEWYYALLRPIVSRVDIWRTTYTHVLQGGPDAIVQWIKGTGLRPYLDPLDEDQRAAFLARYRDAVAATHPTYEDGSILLPYPRLFIVATR